jgi:hypothetical protein
VTAQPSEKPVVRPPETGWAQARRLRDNRLRTCVPAVDDGKRPWPRRDPEGNIVRGED